VLHCLLSQTLQARPVSFTASSAAAAADSSTGTTTTTAGEHSAHLQQLQQHLALPPAQRRFGRRCVPEPPARSSAAAAGPDWLVLFEGRAAADGAVSCKVVHNVSLTPRARTAGAPVSVEPFLCPDLPAGGREGPCFVGAGTGGNPPAPRLFNFVIPSHDGTGTLYGVCLLLYRLCDEQQQSSSTAGDSTTSAAASASAAAGCSGTAVVQAAAGEDADDDAYDTHALPPPQLPTIVHRRDGSSNSSSSSAAALNGSTTAGTAANGYSSSSSTSTSSSAVKQQQQQQQGAPPWPRSPGRRAALPGFDEDDSEDDGDDTTKGRSASPPDLGSSEHSSAASASSSSAAAAAAAAPQQPRYLPCGVCALAGAPSLEPLRAGLSAYWAEHRERIMAAAPPLSAGQQQQLLVQWQAAAKPRDAAAAAAVAAAPAPAQPRQMRHYWTGIDSAELTLQVLPHLSRAAAASATAASTAAAATAADHDMAVLLRCLHPRHLCLLVASLLCEHKVVLLSDRLTLLALTGEALKSLLAPLSWSHVYAPLLPCSMAPDLLQCPTPYLLGLPRAYAGGLELPHEVISTQSEALLQEELFVSLRNSCVVATVSRAVI
jgi:DENN (AEX-3) domain